MERVVLAHPADLAGFRAAVRDLVARGVPPAHVAWTVGPPAGPAPGGPPAPALRVPRAFLLLAERAICHRDPTRFRLLHEALLGLAGATPARGVPAALDAMARDVAAELERLEREVRFLALPDDDGRQLAAWFEPRHHVLRAGAGALIRRHAGDRWSILGPEASLHWDGLRLHDLPGAGVPPAGTVDPLAAAWPTFRRRLPRSGPLDRLRAEAAACTRCGLHAAASQTVFGEGPADARLMLVGEQPGDQEDLAGRPFVGPAGQLLDQCLAEAGIDRARCYVTNAVKHFRFEWRGRRRLHQSPEAAHIEACRWWLDRELDLVRPALVVMLGASAGRALLGRPVTVGRERGRPIPLPGALAGLLTVHPSYLLRIEAPEAAAVERARFVADLRAAQALAEAA
ncbi:UdgX family uracil-DNA binding protein [Thermaurantiacus sp.]